MFLLHETTQRRVCRVIFLVGCVLPTLLTLGWIVYWHRPWRQSDWQQALAQQLHIRAEIDSVDAPKPGIQSITNLRLADLRTGKILGAFSKLNAQRANSRLILQAECLELQADQLTAVVNTVATWLATEELEPIDLHVDRLTITSPKLQALELEDLQIGSDLSDPAIQRFRLLALAEDKAIQLVLEHRDGNLHANLDLQKASLPAWLVGTLVPGVSGCNEARFSGVVSARSEDQEIRGSLQGRLDDVDLQQWSAAVAPHRLQCYGQVELEQFTWTDETVGVARGRILASGGAASYSIFHALKDPRVFSCGVGSGLENIQAAPWEELVIFDKLAFRFQVSEAGVVLLGECKDEALVVASSGPLLFSPPKGTFLPVANLVQLFHRPEKGWLPDTVGAIEMSRGLPLPGKKESDKETITK